ncbi:MAG: DNA polymerase-4 [Colwellia sp.]|jgi:DNA polymerase-4
MTQNRKIIHIDMDCFYAAVEMRDDETLRNVPLAVGGNGPRSVLCTCNYQARKFGVRSAMPAIKAMKLCPDLVIVSGRMSVYQEVSAQIRAIFQRYTQLIEPLSLDEAFLDVTHNKAFNGSATLIAEQIRRDIFNELQLTASAGVAPNKFIAKIASDENKPNGQCVVTPSDISRFVENLPLKKIPGIGPKTAQKLLGYGFASCADIRASSVAVLIPIVGKFAPALYQRSFGIDHRRLETDRVRKSLAIETTFAHDLSCEKECESAVELLYQKLLLRLEKHQHMMISKQGIKLKFNDFTQTTVEQQSQGCDESTFKQLLVKALLRSQSRGIRLIGLTLGFAHHDVKEVKQLSLSW